MAKTILKRNMTELNENDLMEMVLNIKYQHLETSDYACELSFDSRPVLY